MGIFDKFTGTLHPEDGVAPHSAAQVRAALLALNGPDVPFAVRQGAPKERADLVAECRIPELRVTFKTRMHLVPERHEVRALGERWEPSLENAQQKYSRGQGGSAVYRVWGTEQGPDGRNRRVETRRFDTREMQEPLRATVLATGWTWRGVMFKL